MGATKGPRLDTGRIHRLNTRWDQRSCLWASPFCGFYNVICSHTLQEFQESPRFAKCTMIVFAQSCKLALPVVPKRNYPAHSCKNKNKRASLCISSCWLFVVVGPQRAKYWIITVRFRKCCVFILSTPPELSYWKCNFMAPFPAFWWRKPRYTEFGPLFQKTWMPANLHGIEECIRAEQYSFRLRRTRRTPKSKWNNEKVAFFLSWAL